MNPRLHPAIVLPVIISCSLPIASRTVNRTYHDDIRCITDSVIIFTSPATPLLSEAFEVRASLPDAADFGPLQALSVMWDLDTIAGNRYIATLRPWNPMPDEVFDHRYMEFAITRVDNWTNIESVHKEKIKNGFNLDRGENTLGVEIDMRHRTATIYGGNREVDVLYSFTMPTLTSNVMGLAAEGRANVSFAVSEYVTDDMAALLTGLSAQLAIKTARSQGAPSGVYRFLDRQTDTRYCRLGGDYTVALLRATDGGYDIIYLDGAVTEGSDWKPGMKKGHLTPTVFTNSYDLAWYDSSGNMIQAECNATIEQNAILTLNFPTLKSSLRFALMPEDR